jgi:hypothetical protein
VSHHAQLLDLVRSYLPSPSPTAEACIDCLSAIPPEDIPDGPGIENLARAFIHAFFRGDTDGLPPGLAFHLTDWFNFPADPTPFLSAWRSSCSIAEVAHRMRTDPDAVLHLADGLRRRGINLSATPGTKWSK